MKKLLSLAGIGLLSASLAACGGANGGGEDNTITIGASPVPHVAILEQAEPLLEEKGYTLEIEEFTDYIMPNKALEEGELDANYFQHEPYLKSQISDHGYEFVSVGGVHIEPIGVYSKRHKSLEDLPEGATILMSSSIADHGRMLSMLEEKGLITIKEGVEKTAATVEDIAENPKNLKFKADVDAAYLTKAYENDEADAILINGNFALDADLNPAEDAIALESGENNPYANLIVVRKGDEENEKVKALVEVLQSEEIKTFIEENYEGAVLPAK